MSRLVRLLALAAPLVGLCVEASAQTGRQPAPTPSSSLFSDLQGADIRAAGERSVARLEDVVVDAEGRIVEVVIGAGGLLGLGKKLHLLDAAELPHLGGAPIVAPSLSAEQVAALPFYDPDDPPDSTGPVMPATLPPAARAARPAGSGPATAAPSDTARASGAVGAEASVAGSGTDGSVPQRGSEASAVPSPLRRLGDLVGAEVKGKLDGVEIEDFRIAGGRVVDVILSRSLDEADADLRVVDFIALVIAGDRQDPDIALGPSAAGRPIGK